MGQILKNDCANVAEWAIGQIRRTIGPHYGMVIFGWRQSWELAKLGGNNTVLGNEIMGELMSDEVTSSDLVKDCVSVSMVSVYYAEHTY